MRTPLLFLMVVLVLAIGPGQRAAAQAGANIGLVVQAIRQHCTPDITDDFIHTRVVSAHDSQTVERQVMQKLDEPGPQAFDVTVVGRHVVGIDIGHDCQHRLQVYERCVRLIGFRDEVLALTQSRVRVGALEPATDNEGRIKSAFGKNAGDQARRRCLAMRSGNRDRIAKTHEFREHLGALHNGHHLLACGNHFGIGFIDRAGDDNGVCILDIACSVADEYSGALLLKALCLFAGLQIRTLHGVAQAQHDFGNAGHAGTADSDEMDSMNSPHSRDHVAAPASSKHMEEIRRRESGFDNARALAARDCNSDLSHNQFFSKSDNDRAVISLSWIIAAAPAAVIARALAV